MTKELFHYLQHCPTAPHWEKIGIRQHHGICAPLFSLHSHNSCGIGEYLDLKLLIDWCALVKMDVIQLLPLNEVGIDPSPYNALTSCGLDPIYISLKSLPFVERHENLKKKLHAFDQFEKYSRISYAEVRKQKFDFLFLYYSYVFSEIIHNERYQKFITQNTWLKEYALFRVIKDEYGKKTWQQWPEKIKNISEKHLHSLYEKYAKEMEFYYFLQYLCFSQMMEVKQYADEKKVLLVGDIPYLISPDSLDVWIHRRIFDTSHVAGCPPDMFNADGQKWGFFLFNWEAQKKDNYSWWHQRLNVASSCYHSYRIDHLVGFFRIWSMLPNEDPTNGKFLPKDPQRWFKEGKEKLQMMINATQIFPIAEDLGLIPQEVYKILKELGIPGMKVMRWERTRYRYTPINEYNPISMTITGTHDTETLAQWWKKYPKEAKMLCHDKKWDYSPLFTKKHRKALLQDSHHTSSLFHVNPLQEYLALFDKLVSENIDDERINIAGKNLPTNWTYRFRPSLEEMIEHKGLTSEMQDILPIGRKI